MTFLVFAIAFGVEVIFFERYSFGENMSFFGRMLGVLIFFFEENRGVA